MSYDHGSIEKKWAKYWDEHETFKCDVHDFSKPKYYALDMFPYPSGQGLQDKDFTSDIQRVIPRLTSFAE